MSSLTLEALLKAKETLKEYKKETDEIVKSLKAIRGKLGGLEIEQEERYNRILWAVQNAEKKFLRDNKDKDPSDIGGLTRIPFGMKRQYSFATPMFYRSIKFL